VSWSGPRAHGQNTGLLERLFGMSMSSVAMAMRDGTMICWCFTTVFGWEIKERNMLPPPPHAKTHGLFLQAAQPLEPCQVKSIPDGKKLLRTICRHQHQLSHMMVCGRFPSSRETRWWETLAMCDTGAHSENRKQK